MGKKIRFLTFGLTFVVLLSVLAGCNPPTPTPPPPQVDISVSPAGPIEVGQQASIAANSNSEIISYTWSVNRGSLDNKEAPAVIYTAPQAPGQDIVTLVVKGTGGTITKSVQLTIQLPPPAPTQLAPTQSPAVVQPAAPGAAPTPSGSTSTTCTGNSSAEYLTQAWAAYNGANYPKLLACSQGAINGWTVQANQQQTRRLHENKCDITPDPGEKQAYFSSYWALSDIGAAWFLLGKANAGMQNYAPARDAYKTAVDQYSCAYVWDNNGWFWSVKTAAQQEFDAIKDK